MPSLPWKHFNAFLLRCKRGDRSGRRGGGGWGEQHRLHSVNEGGVVAPGHQTVGGGRVETAGALLGVQWGADQRNLTPVHLYRHISLHGCFASRHGVAMRTCVRLLMLAIRQQCVPTKSYYINYINISLKHAFNSYTRYMNYLVGIFAIR